MGPDTGRQFAGAGSDMASAAMAPGAAFYIRTGGNNLSFAGTGCEKNSVGSDPAVGLRMSNNSMRSILASAATVLLSIDLKTDTRGNLALPLFHS